jgi:hypothetical protein
VSILYDLPLIYPDSSSFVRVKSSQNLRVKTIRGQQQGHTQPFSYCYILLTREQKNIVKCFQYKQKDFSRVKKKIVLKKQTCGIY